MGQVLTNNQVSAEEVIQQKENQINNFASRLTAGQYKVILYNGQTPILTDDLGFIELIIDDLDEDSKIELKGNVMTIHTETEIIELKGRKRMTDGEIFARQYLDMCEGSRNLIIKDDEEQIEMREDNFKDASKYYSKCRDIVNIRQFIKDESKKVDRIYNMNWDCLWISYKSGNRELWQRA